MENRANIPEYDGYSVDIYGVVYGKLGKPMSSWKNPSGYENIKLKHSNGKLTTNLVHRLVYMAFNGDIPKGYWINHKDGVKSNNSLDNLEAVTPSANHIHARDVLGREYCRGEDVHTSKLNETAVEAIRYLRKAGWRGNKIARAFEVSCGNVSHIVNNKTYKHLK